VTLYIDVSRTLEIVSELKKLGWMIGKDFDFAYFKPTFDNFSYEAVNRKHTVFTFYNDSNASYFMLRWG
jgi:hypothetical protein